jgi:UDP-glucose 4-epimerase
MKALITGGAGFIGSHLCQRLLEDGHKVVVIDDLSTGSMDNIAPFLDNPNFEFINDTVDNEIVIHTLMDRCDFVFHLAAAVGVSLIVEQPVRTIETNIRGTEVILKVAKKFGRKLVLASTSEVYGKNSNVPFQEEDDCVFGATTFNRWSYACSKAIDEFLGFAYHRQFDLPVLIMRLFNTVGERQTGKYGMVIPRFVRAALNGEPLIIHGDGKQSRCFGYVGDVINGMLALVAEPRSYGHVFNIGSNEEITIGNLALKIKEMTGSSSELRYIPYEKVYGKEFEDMRRRVPDLTKIRNLVGYKAEKTIDQILEIIISHFQQQR